MTKLKTKFTDDCFNAFKKEFLEELKNFKQDCDIFYLNHFGIYYYDEDKITYENRITYSSEEYNKHPYIKFSIKNSTNLQDKILKKIMNYVKDIGKEYPEYEFFYNWMLVDARTDYSIFIKRRRS